MSTIETGRTPSRVAAFLHHMSGSRSARWALSAALVAGAAAQSLAATTIEVNGYTGRYFVTPSPGTGTELTGNQTLALAAGLHYLDNGSFLGGSYIPFTVDAAGVITSIDASAASAASGVGTSTLTLNSTTISINPGGYAGLYLLSSHFIGYQTYSGARNFAVIKGLRYAIDNGSALGTSAFQFTVDASGNVSNSSVAGSATGSGATLTFGNSTLTVDPQSYGGTYVFHNYRNVAASYSGVRTFTVIPGLLFGMDNSGAPGGSNDLRFTLSATGVIASITPAAAASGVGGTTLYIGPAVVNGFALLYNPLHAKKAGAVMPIKIRVLNAGGANISSAGLAVVATTLTKTDNTADGTVTDPGNSNPDFNFRYDGGLAGYIFNLDTNGLSSGTWALRFTIAGVASSTYEAIFNIK